MSTSFEGIKVESPIKIEVENDEEVEEVNYLYLLKVKSNLRNQITMTFTQSLKTYDIDKMH